MRPTDQAIQKIASVKELHALMGLPSPLNPLITFIDHAADTGQRPIHEGKWLLELYNISVKKSFKGKLKYGRTYYDFDEGTLSFMGPHQILSIDGPEDRSSNGWSLLFHPDLVRKHPLGQTIHGYGFFSYATNEALHLSDEEEKTIESIVQNIQREISARLDAFSQSVIVSNLELLLNYSNRFYHRQFLTRNMATHDLLMKFERVLEKHFENKTESTLPTVEKIAGELGVSTSYLSDMLRSVTGQNTQQHIHARLIEQAKHILTTTRLTVSEIAYRLGFEYPQSFNKLFKNKTNVTPLEFRNSFN